MKWIPKAPISHYRLFMRETSTWRSIPPTDLVAGCVLAVLGVAEGAAGLTGTPDNWYAVVCVPLAMLGVVLRRARPLTAVIVFAAATLSQAALGSDLPGGWSEGLALPVIIYALGAHLGLRDGLCLAGAAIVGQSATIVLAGDPRPGNFVFALTVSAVAWLAGRGMRLATERGDLLAERRLAQERARIARELHDVVAHHVTAIVVQSSAERRDLPPGNPAASVLADVERRGRETLTELRRLLGVLRLDDDRAVPLAPQPRLADLPRLVRSMSEQGLEVTWQATGDPVPIDDGTELAIYRVVQESLTNAGKHAGEPHADVMLTWRPGQVEVEVRSHGQQARRHLPGSGFGLRAMADRVQACGGEFSARRTPEGFRVHARLPVAAA